MKRLTFYASIAASLAVLAGPADAKGRSGGILPGATAKDPLNIDAGKLDYFDQEQKLIYSGSVIVTNGPSTLKASRITIFLEGKGVASGATSNDRVKHIEADGPVTLVSKDQIGTGDHGSYDKAENKVFLSGNVTLTQGDNIVKGDRLVYDVTSGVASIQGGGAQGGRVRSTFLPGSAKQ
ncbi:LptA/OstA family protein [Methylocystis parvus]|uniref:Organic solvent tolerance protein OstA n=1 Tax=Methylocystis parvus TaxID=134 RepID=A0A6B8M4N2_9HYPH|nr:LptA/OstA family protein [Methylocystis parvus]QGM97881.1 organic solvent tolerance protein OstA [Methylocystis parvus]WBK01809.1 organic solvent tolerance protein OstA [Methylocystis parvus OBBP]